MKIGLDVGSTTIKAAVLSDDNRLLFSKYERHFSQINTKAAQLLAEIQAQFYGAQNFQLCVSGSAGMGLAELCEIPFEQEVFATRVCAKQFAPQADVIIELGGEDAKILFLSGLSDARMNGSCAGGTGAFIDQMATLLKLTPEQLNEKAKEHEKIYSIASRCGVFAKSDIQPLLNQGARVEDICASILYCVVNQTVAGLAQGRPIEGNVMYLGGPLTFMSELRLAFDNVLHNTGILPQNSLYFVALGAALQARGYHSLSDIQLRLTTRQKKSSFAHTKPFFESQQAYEQFAARHAGAQVLEKSLKDSSGKAHLGIDAGSTTLKAVLIDEQGDILFSSYRSNSANPVPLVKEILEHIYEECPGIFLCSVTTTGYGEQLCREAFNADYGVVETMAHFAAAKRFQPDVDFIIDIGGQDMKCFQVEDGAISNIFLNEACSSGCGSFLQTFASALGQDIDSFAKLGLFADAPVELGSRCTVFMNSSVKQAQKDGASIENISAGLSLSVVKNALYKVIRASDPSELGQNVVVQGGTFYNDAVLRAFENEMGIEVTRPSIAGLMGAYGAALYGREQSSKEHRSSVLSKAELHDFSHRVQTTRCKLCTNHCELTVNHFSGGRRFISGNRCDRPTTNRKAEQTLNIYEYKLQLLDQYKPVPGPRGKVGIPLGLNMLELLPFWHTLLTRLGFEMHMSPKSSRELYFDGQQTIPSDTVCYPAKLMHGHIHALCSMEGIDTIFYPCMTYNVDEKLGDNHFNCPVVAYYPEVIDANCTAQLEGKKFIYDYVGIHRPNDFVANFTTALTKYFTGITTSAVGRATIAAYREYRAYLRRLRKRGEQIIQTAREKKKPIIVLAGRPYHVDNEINHGIDQLIVSQGAAVISEDCVSHLMNKENVRVLNQWTYHARLYAAARYIINEPDMNLVQLVSFGCGLDAVTADEVREILQRGNKLYTQIKIDEIANLGAVNIRLRSLFAALDAQAKNSAKKEAI